MNRRAAAVVLATGAAAALLGALLAWWRSSPNPVLEGATDALFAARFEDADGTAQPLAKWRGRTLVVNFWATWCAPCIEEMPDLQKVRSEYLGRGVEVVGLGIDHADKIRAFRDQLGLTLPLLVAGSGGAELNRSLGNSAGVLPFTVLVGADGTIRERHVGRVRPEQLRRWLDAALNGR